MTLDCEELHECADLLHEAAAERMSEAQRGGPYARSYVPALREVAAIEEVAAEVERKLDEGCHD